MELILGLIAGTIGGNVAGKVHRNLTLGPVLNSLAGCIGGGFCALLLGLISDQAYRNTPQDASGLDLVSCIAQAIGCGISGAAVLVILSVATTIAKSMA